MENIDVNKWDEEQEWEVRLTLVPSGAGLPGLPTTIKIPEGWEPFGWTGQSVGIRRRIK